MIPHEDSIARVIAILDTEFPTLKKLSLAPNTALLSSGLLDSFAIVTLVAELETAFGIELDVEKLDLAQFETPSSISELCLQTSG